MDIKEEREAFESTLKQIGRVDDSNFTVADDGSYEWDSIHFAWTIWQAAKAQAVPEWISTSERMPDHGEFVLILAPACEGTMFVGIRDEEDDNFWYDPTDMSYLELKYAPSWMPLPDAPQEPTND
ncbi:DUF551 domain-containing protein [Acinetobacter sp.]|uniref:DUF551 domain-containing protein n=1 Tax=Acinetobacter sp. TaxID=472 RepID=UPI003D03754D